MNRKQISNLFKIIITIILLTPLALAVTPPQAPLDTISVIRAENHQTRTELTKYVDAKIDQFWVTVKQEATNTYEENLKAFDARIHALAQKTQVQFLIAIFFAIILAQACWYLIKRKLDKVTKKIPKKITRDDLTADKYGSVSPEFQAKLDAEQKSNVKETPFLDTSPKKPTPPSVTTIEQAIQQRKEEKMLEEKKKQEKELEAEIKKQREKEEKLQAEAKKIEEKLKKESEKVAEKLKKKTKKDVEKLEKLKKQFLPPPEKPKIEVPTPPDALNTNLDEGKK